MASNIFRPLKFGKEVFYPKSSDENSFVMDWTMEAGGKVPSHLHQHMNEHFLITKGEVLFTVNGEKIKKTVGDELYVPLGTIHSIANASKDQIAVTVTYHPPSDTGRMFEILSILDEQKPGSMMNMGKFFYLSPKLGLRDFSTPHPPFVFSIMKLIINIIGKLSGWDKLKKQFQ